MSDLDLSIGFNLNNEQVDAELDQTRERIRGVGNEATRQNAAQMGLLERLRSRYVELAAEREKATSVASIEKYNIRLAELAKEIDRLNKVGKQGFDDMGKAIPDFSRPIGTINRLTEAAKLYGKAIREATNTDIIEKYNRKLVETQLEIKKLSTAGLDGMATKAKSNFNGLQNSINQISRELPAFTYSAQTGFMAISNNIPILIDQIGNLKKQNAELVASGQKGVPVWKQLVSGLFSWGTALSLGVTLITVYGKEIGNFFATLFQGKEAFNATLERFKSLNEAIKSTDFTKAYTGLAELKINLDLAKQGMASKEAVIKQYNESLGKTAGQVKTLDGVEKGIAANADSYIKMTLYKAAANLQLAKASEEAVKQQEAILNSTKRDSRNNRSQDNLSMWERLSVAFAQDEGVTNKTIDDANKREIDGFKKSQEEKEKLASEFLKKAAAEAKKMGGLLGLDYSVKDNKSENAFNSILNSRKGIYEKLKALDDEYRVKSFASDKEELEALASKFNKMREIIVKENEKIKKYNKENPKKAIDLIDVTEVDPIEKRATSDLVFKQQTEKLNEELGKQKELFSQYEAFKTKTSEAEADKRFKADLKGFKDYGARLQSEIDKINQTPADEQTGGQLDLLAKLKADKEAYDRDKKNKELQQYADDLKEFQTYAEKRLALQKKYSELAEKFRGNGEDGKAQQAIDTGIEEVSKLDEANVQKMASYKKVFDYVGKRSKQSTLDAIEEFQKELNAAKITAEARIKIQKEIEKLKTSVERGSGKDIEQLASALGQVASEFASINGNIGNIANVLVGAAKAYVSVKNDLKTLNDPKADTTAKIGAGLGIAGAAVSVVTSVVGYFKGLKAAKEAAWKAMNDYQAAAIKGELDYQALLRKRENDDVKRGKNSYRAIVDQLELLKKQSPEIQKAYDRIFESLQGQSYVSDIGYKHGTWLRKAKTWDIMSSLAGSEYADLEKLYTQGKLKDQAKADFESLKALKEELKEAGIAVEDLQAQLNELLTGTSVSGLADSLQQLFENGKYAAQDFGDSFTEIMRKAINTSFKEKLLKDAMQPFYDEFAALFVNGTPTEDEINALKAKYIALGQEFGDKFKELEKITGQSLTTDEADKTSPNTLKGAVENITAKQADVLSANIAGQRLAQLEGNQVNKDGFASLAKSGAEQLAVIRQQHLTQMEIAANTLRTANNTDGLKESLTGIKDEIQTLNKKVGSSGDAKKAMGG